MRCMEPTDEQKAEWDKWVAERPEVVRKIAQRFDPWTLYCNKKTDQYVIIYSFSEDGTITVIVSGEFNKVLFERKVFGINPDDLEECDLPPKDHPTGALFSFDEVDENIDLIRKLMKLNPEELNIKMLECIKKNKKE